MINLNLILILTLGIILIRAYWIFEEITEYKDRASWQTVKNNTIEALILIAQIASAIYFPMPISSLMVTIGIILYITGMALAIWAKITMKQSWGPPAIHNINKQDTLVK